ncbi:hypothetical protein [Pedobacter sp. MR2016-24]|uniref:hypothetical protein n=1 Tax=Pedobacter sp. MR2016-24 TaxID=2994466 RepID=UPI002247658C|nr:hypothetical protein [Pedobacter sp. MR2016-24]MCX2485498.1 hypothetical protein [Pedobacter sp. MR2016-24]
MITEGLYKAIQVQGTLQKFFLEMFKQVGNEILQGELDDHLAYEKYASKGRIQFKILHNGKVVNKYICPVIGLKNDFLKEILGM